MIDTIARVLAGCAGRLLAGCAGLLLAGSAFAQTAGYPDRPVKMIVPFAAGGPTDVVARLISQKLSEKFSQQFFIENMAGAGGNLGMGAAARAAGDGYTILFVSSSYTVNPSLYAKAPYDPDKDLAPVTKAAGSPNGLFVNPSIPAKSVKELVDLLKANPGKYTFASPGIGTTPHLASELFKLTFGLDFALAPFPGGGPSIQSVVAGHTPICIQAIPPAMELVRAGKLRALGLTAKTRSPARRAHVRRARHHQSRIRDDAGRAGAGGDAEAHRRSAAGGNCAHRAPARREREDAGAGPRAGRHVVGRVRRLHQGRHRQVEEGDHRGEDTADRRMKIPLIGG
jgi:tripartite-type tricarboxylate transporter receptor subunit TctC